MPLRAARSRLKQFRGATILAIALTGLLLLVFSPEDSDLFSAAADSGSAGVRPGDVTAQESAEEAVATVKSLIYGFYSTLPRVIVAIIVLFTAWLFSLVTRPLLRRLVRTWESLNAFSAVVGLVIWFLALGIAVSVLAGDIRGLVGSLGLIGLALSWALQAPIESFTGWLLNSFKGYYRVGDRIAVGDVFGDVYRIDFLTTTVWEIGDPFKEGFVHAEQPTGRLVTFPNNAVLTGTVVNLTRDFPFVWDELMVQVSNESDLAYTVATFEQVARDLFGSAMADSSLKYARILEAEGLEVSVANEPKAFVALSDSWTEVTLRYLVNVRERRKWKSDLAFNILEKINKEDHGGRILAVYPRRQVQFVDPHGVPRDFRDATG
jgi:small-conductance mechanosensitive channel